MKGVIIIMMKYLQKLGKALMLPVAVLPVAAIMMGIGYALTPYVLIQMPMIFISNLMTVQEGAFYFYINSFATFWCGILIMSAMMMIHDYTLGKAIVTMVATIVGMMFIIFVFLLFFSLVSDAVAYFISLYKEVIFRFY